LIIFLEKYFPELNYEHTRTSITVYKKTITQNEWLNVESVMQNPDALYVFGDNTIRKGEAGQAVIRNCPNSLGVCTKRVPSMSEDSFFTDTEEDWKTIKDDLENLKKLSKDFKYIIFPGDGIGTGLSKMPEKCPKNYKKMCAYLKDNFGFIQH
jgi:hypothetical protein